MVIATLFREKRAAARTASVFLIGIFSVASIFPFTKLGFSQTNWQEPFEAYGFRNLPAQESTLTQQQVDYNMLIKEASYWNKIHTCSNHNRRRKRRKTNSFLI